MSQKFLGVLRFSVLRSPHRYAGHSRWAGPSVACGSFRMTERDAGTLAQGLWALGSSRSQIPLACREPKLFESYPRTLED